MAEKHSIQTVAPKDVVSNVLNLLIALSHARSLEPLKQLFWSELNYERANQPLSRRSWPDKTSTFLLEDPLLFATGGNDDGFDIIYLRLASDQLSLAEERSIVTQLLKDHLDSLFFFRRCKDRVLPPYDRVGLRFEPVKHPEGGSDAQKETLHKRDQMHFSS